MKYILLICITIVLLTACTSTDIEGTKADSQDKWELVKMTGRTQNSETSGNAMEWQEYYLFNSNSTFSKFRTRDGKTSQSSGTYKTITTNTESYIELIYYSQSEIIGSCYGNLTEELYFSSSAILVNTWQNCDGPRLEYNRLR